MGRPKQVGLKFFSFDVGFFVDDKVMLIEEEVGIDGIYVLIRLLCKIYEEGYYYQFTEDESRLFVRKIGIQRIDKAFVDKLVSVALKREFFDKKLFEKFGILTSHGVQKRYLEATKRFKEVVLNPDYLLIGLPARANVNADKSGVDTQLPIPFENDCTKERLYEIFFFRNFPDARVEVDRFLAFYSARGWCDGNGNGITDKYALAEFWLPQAWRDSKKDKVLNVPVKLLNSWKKVYDKIKAIIGEDIYTSFLRLKPLRFVGETLVLCTDDEDACRLIEDKYIEVFRKALRDVYGNGIKIEYSVVDKS